MAVFNCLTSNIAKVVLASLAMNADAMLRPRLATNEHLARLEQLAAKQFIAPTIYGVDPNVQASADADARASELMQLFKLAFETSKRYDASMIERQSVRDGEQMLKFQTYTVKGVSDGMYSMSFDEWLKLAGTISKNANALIYGCGVSQKDVLNKAYHNLQKTKKQQRKSGDVSGAIDRWIKDFVQVAADNVKMWRSVDAAFDRAREMISRSNYSLITPEPASQEPTIDPDIATRQQQQQQQQQKQPQTTTTITTGRKRQPSTDAEDSRPEKRQKSSGSPDLAVVIGQRDTWTLQSSASNRNEAMRERLDPDKSPGAFGYSRDTTAQHQPKETERKYTKGSTDVYGIDGKHCSMSFEEWCSVAGKIDLRLAVDDSKSSIAFDDLKKKSKQLKTWRIGGKFRKESRKTDLQAWLNALRQVATKHKARVESLWTHFHQTSSGDVTGVLQALGVEFNMSTE